MTTWRGLSTWPYITVEVVRHAERVRGGDDIDPGGDVDFLVAQDFAHAVVEDFRRGAGNRSEAGVAQHRDVLRILHPHAARAEHDLHRRERVDMNLRIAAFDRSEQVAILEVGHLGIDAALHANFGRAARDRVADLGEDGLVGMVVGVGFPSLALEAAELASDETDIGEVDVAIDDVGDFVADVFGARESAHLITARRSSPVAV